MGEFILKRENIARNTLEEYSMEMKEALAEIDLELLRVYTEDMKFRRNDVSEQELEQEKMEFLKSLVYEKITYPKDVPIFLANDRDGDFEYDYVRNLLKEHGLNVVIKDEIVFWGSPAMYLVEKIVSSEESFLFFYEKIDSGRGRKNKVVIVAC